MEPSEEFISWLEELIALSEAADDLNDSISRAKQIAAAIAASSHLEKAKAALLFSASSIILNCAFQLEDVEVINHGRDLARQALAATAPDEPLHFQCRYNVANATNALCDLELPEAVQGATRVDWEPQLIQSRLKTRADLQHARREFFEIGTSHVADAHTRSASYCNLGNLLDHSGRWAEAYDFYLRALEADGSNGNAAGNLAQLLRTRIATGIGQSGHIAAVYDKYVTLAQQLREGTLEYAAATVADRWDQLERTESEGHLAHGLDGPESTDTEYRAWVADLRLALSPAVEGLGTDELRWDSATIEVLYGENVDDMTPPILGAMNVLKSDFLVSRRLAFDAIVQFTDDLAQAAEDSGYYVETLDYSLYGVQYSKLLLAQRSALDVLDKTAVVANEHFGVGDVPKRVSFRGFWTTKTGELRAPLLKGPGRSLPNLALAELASDMAATGMYAASQALRNAGTHRIVHAALLSPTGVTEDSRSRIDLVELVDSTVLALQVTRSAYLYLIDLVAMWNHPDDHQGPHLPFPNLGYIHDRATEDPSVDPSGPDSAVRS
ncbi:LA2681 family HEPN domain-containing protein [Nocardioides sp. WV_118_6]